MDLYGLIVLLVALVVVSVFLTAGAFGGMFLLHRYGGDRFPVKTYGAFDFDHIQKPQLSELLVRLAVVNFSPTLLFHLLEFVLVGVYINAHPTLVTLGLWILETAAFAGGFVYILKLERPRAILLTSVSSALYILLYGIFIFQYLH